MAMIGARAGATNWLRRLTARALARELATFVIPGPEIARAMGLDLAAVGLRTVATPRHASILVLVGDLPGGLARAAAVAYAQMPRPRAILAVGVPTVGPLPAPDIAAEPRQDALAAAVRELRQRVEAGAFGTDTAPFDVAALRTETRFTCPMHPEIVRDGPGRCPICGMHLVPQQEVGEERGHDTAATAGDTASGHDTATTVEARAQGHGPGTAASGYTCPMHPEIVRDGPGSCPICGMDLVPRQGADTGAGAAATGHAHGHMADAGAAAKTYSCPMHPEIVRAGPGSCPLCGMDLVAVEAPPRDFGETAIQPVPVPTETGAAEHSYTCPMHPEIARDEPGECPLCGMDLVPRDTEASAARETGPATSETPLYTCPMHPEIESEQPGSCPKCGMDLVPRPLDGATSRLGADHDPAAGHAGHGAAATVRATTGEQEAHPTGTYTCPMHPEILRDSPGRCPLCGMTLVSTGGGAGADGRAADATGTGSGSGDDDEGHVGRAGGSPDLHAAHREIGGPDGGHARWTQSPGHGGEAHGSDAEMGHGAGAMPEPLGERTRGAGIADAGHPGAGHDGQIDAPAAGGERDADREAMPESSHGGHAATAGTAHNPRDMGGMDHGTHDMAGMGHDGHDMGGMGHDMPMEGGFMSMVAMTKDLPRSRDGLPMEWLEVPFGPLFPGLPGGLALTLTLDGDVVARAALGPGPTGRGLAASWRGPAAALPGLLADLDPLAPVGYRVLALRALETVADIVPDEHTARARVGALERERAASHLNWLASFGDLLGDRWLAGHAAALQLALLGADNPAAVAGVAPAIRRLIGGVERTPLLRRRLAGVGRAGAGSPVPGNGPVARAAGAAGDARSEDPAYRALGFAPVVGEGDDALARLRVRLGELDRSLDLIGAAGAIAADAPAGADWERATGHGAATVETPRGTATLHLALEGGMVTMAHLDTPTDAHAGLVPAVAEGRELADALAGIASLDLSPWELDR